MQWYRQYAAELSLRAIHRCLEGHCEPRAITHLITVSCTGMSAPGLDLELVQLRCILPPTVYFDLDQFYGLLCRRSMR